MHPHKMSLITAEIDRPHPINPSDESQMIKVATYKNGEVIATSSVPTARYSTMDILTVDILSSCEIAIGRYHAGYWKLQDSFKYPTHDGTSRVCDTWQYRPYADTEEVQPVF